MSRPLSWLRAASAGFIIAIPVMAVTAIAGVIAYWGLGLDRLGNASLGENFIVFAVNAPVPERRAYGLIATLPALLLWLYSMWRLFVMFLRFHTGRVIGLETVRHMRAFSLFAFLAVMAGFLLSGVMRWAMGVFDAAPLWTHLGFSTTHAAVLFTSAVVYVASYIIEEAYAYKRETEEYV